MVDLGIQACEAYYKIRITWASLPHHKTYSCAFCPCCSELMRTSIHNFVKSVERECKDCSVGMFHIQCVFIKYFLSFEQTERDSIVLLKKPLYLSRVTQSSSN